MFLTKHIHNSYAENVISFLVISIIFDHILSSVSVTLMKDIKDLSARRDTCAHGLEDIFLKITQPNVRLTA